MYIMKHKSFFTCNFAIFHLHSSMCEREVALIHYTRAKQELQSGPSAKAFLASKSPWLIHPPLATLDMSKKWNSEAQKQDVQQQGFPRGHPP
jgi:hypothetical protein